MPLRALGNVLAVAALPLALLAPGAASTPSPRPVTSDDLARAQLGLTRAQTAYTQAQLAVLQAAPPWQSTWAGIGTVVTVISVIGGLGFTASQLLLSAETTRESNRLQVDAQKLQQETQQDTEFFDIINKFADKDSALSRACAATLLGEVAHRYRFIFQRLPIAQLAFGLELETDVSVLAAIVRALREAKAQWPLDVNAVLEDGVQQRVRARFIAALADFVAANGLENPPVSRERSLEIAADVTSRPPNVLAALVATPDFAHALAAAPGRLPARERLAKTQAALVLASSRSNAIADVQA